jgi:hypothetical protein
MKKNVAKRTPPSRRRYLRHLHLSVNPRLRSWSYQKARKNPAGVRGRPRSPIPASVRRQAARLKYRQQLAARGVSALRLLLPADAAARLRHLARERGTSPGAYVAALLPGL